MASKRMFDKAIIDTDRFMDLSMSSKALYFLLGMEADDEGFVSYKKVMRIHGGNEDDIKILTIKGFVIMFDSGVVVITDWHKNNYLASMRIKPTEYQNELQLLSLTKEKKYVFNKCLTRREEKRGEEKRIEENRGENTAPTKRKKFIKPTVEEISQYCIERKNQVNPQRFFDFYESKDWLIGKNKMKDWKACVRTWENTDKKNAVKFEKQKYDKFNQ